MSGTTFRIRIISVLVIVFALCLVTKLYLVQIASGEAFSERADEQYIRPVDSIFNRGTIFFRAKDGTLMAAASLKTGYTIAVNPKLIKDPEGVYKKIVAIIPTLDHTDFIARATKPNDSYEEIVKRADPTVADQIEALNVPGLNIYKEEWRYYPAGSLASQVIGFVGYKGTTLGGRYGLENQYDTVLQRTQQDMYVNFFAEIFSDIHNSFTNNGNTEGDIVSSIEPNVQAQLEEQLQIVNDQYHSVMTAGIIMDPMTGEIYAMGANPSFDPNNYGSVKNVSLFTNPLVQNVYEMGSVVKSLTMATGLDTGAVTASSTYNDTGCEKINGSTICNYDLRARGPKTPMQTILNDSLNLGAAYVENKVGNQVFAQYMRAFGLGSPTGIDLPGEVSGLVSNLNSPRDVEYATASFGQGIAITPVEMIRALAVLANGGTLVTPHVVNKIDYTVGYSHDVSYPAGPQVIKPSTSKAITQMLDIVGDDALLNGAVKLTHYSMAAKTGTAQIVDPSTGKYYPDQYLHSFFGYFPTNNPRFIIFLYTVKPQNVEYASHSLTEPFVNLEKFLINYYELPPDR